MRMLDKVRQDPDKYLRYRDVEIEKKAEDVIKAAQEEGEGDGLLGVLGKMTPLALIAAGLWGAKRGWGWLSAKRNPMGVLQKKMGPELLSAMQSKALQTHGMSTLEATREFNKYLEALGQRGGFWQPHLKILKDPTIRSAITNKFTSEFRPLYQNVFDASGKVLGGMHSQEAKRNLEMLRELMGGLGGSFL